LPGTDTRQEKRDPEAGEKKITSIMIDTVHWRRAKVFAFEHDLKLSELLGDALDYYIRHRGAYVLGRKIGSDLFPKTRGRKRRP